MSGMYVKACFFDEYNKQFQGKSYNYFVPNVLGKVKVGSKLTVRVDTGKRSKYAVVEVVEVVVRPEIMKADTKPIIGVADESHLDLWYDKKVEREAILNQLNVLRKEVEETAWIEVLAQRSPEAAKLLEKLKNL